MKKLLLSLIICITLFSCEKEPNSNNINDPVSANGSIEYKVNGSLVKMDNVDIATGQYVTFLKQLKGTAPETRYLLNAQKGANNILVMTIVTDSLHLSNYHYNSTPTLAGVFGLSFNGQLSGLSADDDYFDINITSYQSSRISGTFTGKLKMIPGSGSMLITEGKINNVQVIY